LTTVASLLGGLGLFLLGMWMMTEGLKLAAGNALRSILHSWTRSPLRGLLAGMLITAIVQSSSAVTVGTIGFVNAGLLTLTQAVWVIFGTNVGTTMTGWLVALVGVKVQIGALALPLLGIGMLTRLVAGAHMRRAGVGEAVAGFGAFFLGVGILQGGFADLAPRIADLRLEDAGVVATAAFLGLGIALTVLTQSSSAAIAIALTASAGGGVPLPLAAAATVGTNIGTTSTAFLASIGATPAAKRVATAHVTFNLVAGVVALALLPVLLRASETLVDAVGADGSATAKLAAFHTLFNCLGVVLVWPLAPWLVRFLSRRYVSPEERIGRPEHLDPPLAEVPALALRGLVLEAERMMGLAFDIAHQRIAGAGEEGYALNLRQSGLMRLGQEIRNFIGRLSTHPLPEDVVHALQDLVRAVQHVEDLLAITNEVAAEPPLPSSEAAGAKWARLEAAVGAGLGEPGRSGAGTPQAFAAQMAEVETAYQEVKASLLHATARGRLTLAAMEAAFLHAQRLRRAAEAAIKARRRLAPWRQGTAAGDDRAPAMHEASPPASGNDAAKPGAP
jgi:phosphate:Na+ symporter